MKTVGVLLGTLVGVSLFATSVTAAESVTKISSAIWREVQPAYEFKHPMKVTCQEFLDTDAIYRPYVVAWLSGRMIGVVDVADPDEFVPVSVPQMVELCTEEPDEMVYELVRVQ